jgi:hypothetical protein
MGREPKMRLMLMLLVVASAFAGSSTALAAENYVFDPVLSLTGSCNVSTVDPVPDPSEPPCPEGSHPPKPFSNPRSVTTDAYGNIYVVSYGNGTEGRIDVFDAEGFFITEVSDSAGPISIAVDSKGYLYVFDRRPGESKLRRFKPTVYNPADAEIAYGDPPTLITEDFAASLAAIAINPTNDHLFVHYSKWIAEFGSAAEENKLLDDSIGKDILTDTTGISVAVDAAHGRLYASDRNPSTLDGWIRIFDLNSPHALLQTVDGSGTPAGKFGTQTAIAADEGTGHFFVYDGGELGSKVAYEFSAGGEYLSTISYGIKDIGGTVKIWVDNGVNSPNGALNPDGRYLFIPSHPSGVGHSFAYGPDTSEAPAIESTSFTEVSESEAQLRAMIHPGNLETSYVFEYTTRENFEKEGFAGALVADEGQIPAGNTNVEVSASLSGLSPGTAYQFRVVATNSDGSNEDEGAFATYELPSISPCPNDGVRAGSSLLLPDCRAYELVTPADTNARSPIGVGHLGIYFATREASPEGSKVSFQVEGGSFSGGEGTGSLGGDSYLATRTASGWTTANAGPNGAEAPAPLPGSTSPDQGYSFWSTGGGEGAAAIDDEITNYVRYPDGRSELIGRGDIATDPAADGKLISENGGHIIFVSVNRVSHTAVRLEENAPPDGTQAIYDRTSDEVTHVVSLLPGDVTPGAGEDAKYVGASLDGEGVAFSIGSKLYLRYANEETYEVGENVVFAGVAEGGDRIFYVKGGDLSAFDVDTGSVVPFSSSGDVTVVNVSAAGTAAYFVSPSVLTVEGNPLGATAEAGKENLYLSRAGAVDFVGTLTERDVEGDTSGNVPVEGLGLWIEAVGPGSSEAPGRFSIDPSRTTSDGSALLFESRANLTNYDSGGHAQVYRYDSVNSGLRCLSCNPTQTPAGGSASLQSISQGIASPEPLGPFGLVNNLSTDGRRAFFQSEEALVVGDTDDLQDVYEWEEQGVGTCTKAGGCVYLISSGHSARADYLYAVSDSGDDVFFRTSDRLLPIDRDETPSIYDARVGGGFPEGESTTCEGEACLPELPSAPPLTSPQTAPGGPGNWTPRPCPKGKRKAKRNGKVVCVKKHRKHRRHKGSSKKKGAAK